MNITVKDLVWLRPVEYMVCFNIGKMQKDVHCSIAFNDNSDWVNFHLTRNGPNNTKLRLDIVYIRKIDFEALMPIMEVLLISALRPLNFRRAIHRSKQSHYNVRYVCFSELMELPEVKIYEKRFAEKFEALFINGKKRITIGAITDKSLSDCIPLSEIRTLLQKNLKWLPKFYSSPYENGFIISKKFNGPALRYGKDWYTIREDVKAFDMLSLLMDSDLAMTVIDKTISGLARIAIAKTQEELEPYNNPSELIKLS